MSRFGWTRLAFGAALVAVAAIAGHSASASTYKVLHDFCRKISCGDGANPSESFVADQSGNLYGTAGGGAHNGGIVFELSPPQAGSSHWKYRVLYNFCARQNCTDGKFPGESNLILDTAGNIYGTTKFGGPANNDGTVFQLAPNVGHNSWTLTTIYGFCYKESNCADGDMPAGGLTYAGAQSGAPYDGVSPLYGATSGGGRRFGGVAYSLTPSSPGKWTEHVLYAFCAVGGSACTDGVGPFGQLSLDSSGNLFGVTLSAVQVVFKLTPQSGARSWTETVLHTFCSWSNCADGSNSLSGLVPDAAGNMFGVAWDRGGNGEGVAFEVAASGDYSVIYNFCAQTNCTDGSEPLDQGGLVFDPSGNLYGTTGGGGRNLRGTVFKLSGNTLSVLYSFCPKGNCAKGGGGPRGGLLQDSSGDLFGTTETGGKYNQGVVFELSP